jgi:hypothetical protein
LPSAVRLCLPRLIPGIRGAFGLFIPLVDSAIFRLTFLLAVEDYPMQGDTKQRLD